MTSESWTEITSADIVNNIVPKVYVKIHLSYLNDSVQTFVKWNRKKLWVLYIVHQYRTKIWSNAIINRICIFVFL